jgi:phage gp36-like protein
MAYEPKYVTVEDVRAYWSEDVLITLTHDAHVGTAAVDEGILLLAIQWAEAQIDAVIGRRYTLPLETVPDVLHELALDGVLYRLYQRRQKEVKPEDLKLLPNRGWLEPLRKGEVDLPGLTLRADVRVAAPATKAADDVNRYY